jgi:hypothetical protein
MTEKLTFISCIVRGKKHKLVLREKCRCKQWFPSMGMALRYGCRLNKISLSKCKEQTYITSD